ncbi:uncharacterized protein LOC124115336 [Haliotis rufescens]|uniref:uncharacterized protein LOC124115336 n=1 Tax=Haliotis rufescens TaxID=6454 RepID=UPI00201F2E78|nr:uncharacterized protein LOC124115336 [Haliotis rufescens]
MKHFSVCVFLWIFLYVASCSGSTSPSTRDAGSVNVNTTTTPMSSKHASSPPGTVKKAALSSVSVPESSSFVTITHSTPDLVFSGSADNATSTTSPTTAPVQDPFLSMLVNAFLSAANSSSTNTTSPTSSSLPVSLLAMQKKIPGGMGNSLLPFLMGGGSLDLNTITSLFKSLGPQLPSILKGLIQSNTSGLTAEERMCSEDLDTFLVGLVQLKPWALTMVDASGKPGTSILQGATTFFGNFDECLDVVSEADQATGRQVKGDTCVVYIRPPPQLLSALGAGSAGAGAITGAPLTFNWHLCVPQTCGSNRLKSGFQGLLSRVNMTIAQTVCHAEIKNGPVGEDSAAVGGIVLTAILGCLVLLGSAMDMSIRATKGRREKVPLTPGLDAVQLSKISTHFQSKEDEVIETSLSNGNTEGLIGNLQGNGHVENGGIDNPAGPTLPATNGGHFVHSNGGQPLRSGEKKLNQKPKLWQRVLLCFSAVSNGEKILSVKRSPGSLTCLNGIRVLSMSWVILGHTFLELMANAENGAIFIPITKSLSFQVILNGTLAVDTFFVLSGLLVTYLFLKETEKAGGLKVKHMILYYVHRFWRLTPAYAYVIFIYTFVMPYLVDGPTWNSSTDKTFCENNWWANILYINNLYKADKLCIAWSWYLANDMQFYVVAPLALVPLALSSQMKDTTSRKVLKLVGLCVTLGYIITSIICSAYFSYHNYKDVTGNFLNVYIKPWVRIGPFAIGMILGYMLQTKKSKIRISPFLQSLGWFLALAAAGTCTLLTYDDANGAPWGIDPKTAFDTLFRHVWSLVLVWVIFMCCKGKGGIVDWMLSWDWWQPLSRLTYGAYLVHLIFMLAETSTMRSLIFYTQGYIVYRFFGYVCMSFIFSFLLAILVEAPMLQLEKLVLS